MPRPILNSCCFKHTNKLRPKHLATSTISTEFSDGIMKKKVNLILCVLAIFATTTASASCLFFQQNERLTNFCITETIKGKLMDESAASIVAQRLKNEGYFGGIEKPLTEFSINPNVSYNDNINGGNPNRVLQLGELRFEGEDKLKAKSGYLVGLSLNISNRFTYGEGRYVHSNFLAAGSYSPEHHIPIYNFALNSCVKNKLNYQTHADICITGDKQLKRLSENKSNTIGVYVSRLSFLPILNFTEAKFGIKNLTTDNYNQMQLELSTDTLSGQNFSKLALVLGEKIDEKLTMRHKFIIDWSTYLMSKKYNITVSHSYSDGGKLFGISRTENSSSVAITSELNEYTSLTVGFSKTDSSIKYFDSSYPIISLTHQW